MTTVGELLERLTNLRGSVHELVSKLGDLNASNRLLREAVTTSASTTEQALRRLILAQKVVAAAREVLDYKPTGIASLRAAVAAYDAGGPS